MIINISKTNIRKDKNDVKELIKEYYKKNNINFVYNKNGKPYLENENIYFNISHSDKYKVIVIDTYEIGVDIEKIRDYDIKLNKALNIDVKTNKEFFMEWTKREAYIKSKGLTIKEIYNDANDFNYYFETFIFDNHVISICKKKNK